MEIDDPQVDAVVRASGHTREDAWRVLAELNKIGWTVRPITATVDSVPHANKAIAMLEIAEHLASLSAANIRLHAGEMTAAEMRAVKAVLHWQARELLQRAPKWLKPMIQTAHFHGREMPLTSVLFALAGQEGNDGDEGNAMQAAGEALVQLQREVGRLIATIRVNALRWNPTATDEDIERVIEGQ